MVGLGGGGSTYDYGFRIYNPQLGKFLSVDPLFKSYPWYTPYQYAGNKPIRFIDLDGLEEYDPMRDPDFETRLILTTFYEIKHAFYNTVLRAVTSETRARYKLDESGNETFETEFYQIDLSDNKQFANDLIGAVIDPFAVYGAKPGGPTGFLTKTSFGTTQGSRWIKESIAGWSKKAIDYQEYVTGVKAGNTLDVNGVKFDGIRGNTLLEAKSSYDNFVNHKTGEFYSWFKGKDGLIDQAKRQIEAANGASIEWNFSNKKSMEATQKLFKENGIEGIDLKYNPKD